MSEQKTHVERTMQGFDPEKHCRYTGHPVRQVPSRYCDGRPFIWYVRETDGTNLRVRDFTPDELAWSQANPADFEKAVIAGREWHRAAQKLKYK